MYTAAVLHPISANLLRWIQRGILDLEQEGFVVQTQQGQLLPHHMTINLGKFDENLNEESLLGHEALLKVNQFVYNDVLGVCAAPVIEAVGYRLADPPVIPIKTINEHPHITVCIMPWAKPASSNVMLAESHLNNITIKMDQVYELQARIEHVQ